MWRQINVNVTIMTHTKFKQFALLLALMLPTAWCSANGTAFTDGVGHITIKEAHVEGTPRSSTIQASIDGHTLTVAFSENIGQVSIEVTTATGANVDYRTTPTPNGVQIYIPLAGDYIIAFKLSNGDEYYGEFTVMD